MKFDKINAKRIFEEYLESKTVKHGLLHVHSEYSNTVVKDVKQSIDDIIERALELKAPALLLSDHGTMAGIPTFYEKALSANIEPLIGFEAYVLINGIRTHLIIIAKDEIGYTVVNKLVTASNENIDSNGFPCLTEELLLKFIGPMSTGYGHVILTSACTGGVIASALTENNRIQRMAEKELRKADRVKFDQERWLELSALMEEYDAKLSEFAEIRSVAKTPYKSLKKTLSEAEYAEKEATVLAAKETLAQIKESGAEDDVKALRKSIKDEYTKLQKDVQKIETYKKNYETIMLDVKPVDELEAAAAKKAVWYRDNFSDFYMEVQYHGYEGEAYIYQALAKIASENDIPLVAANDAHITRNTENDIVAREYIRSLNFNKWDGRIKGDEELYLKNDAELASALAKILPVEAVVEAMENVGVIVSMCNVRLSDEKHYPKFISEDGKSAGEYLRQMCEDGAARLFPNGLTAEYRERLEYELSTIHEMGFDDYLCIVQDFIQYAKTLVNLGLGVGPGRGSAAGSLVCYLSGITQRIDPIEYGLLFERFLNRERVSMPDIDVDFAPGVREAAIAYVSKKYGASSVAGIMTTQTAAAKGSIENVARIHGSKKYDDIKHFYKLSDEIRAEIPNEANVKLKDCYDLLQMKFGNDEEAMEIINTALLIEGTVINSGTHAAGIIIGDKNPLSNYIATMYNTESKQWAVQCDMVQAEGMYGLLKMDFLGLKNLQIITDTVQLIQKNHGLSIDVVNIPFDSKVFAKIFATGFTNFIFQFESNGMKSSLINFKPDCFEDIILLVAVYRPGPLQYLEAITDVKNGRKKPTYIIPEMEAILGKTYGYPVYQEQMCA